MGVSVIRTVLFAPRFLPYGCDRREECVGLSRNVVHKRQVETVGNRHGLGIQRGTTYHKHLVGRVTLRQSLLQRSITLSAIERSTSTRKHHVAPIGQRTFGQRLESTPSHHNGVTRGECLESLQIVGKPIKQLVFKSYGIVARHCHDNAQHDINTPSPP